MGRGDWAETPAPVETVERSTIFPIARQTGCFCQCRSESTHFFTASVSERTLTQKVPSLTLGVKNTTPTRGECQTERHRVLLPAGRADAAKGQPISHPISGAAATEASAVSGRRGWRAVTALWSLDDHHSDEGRMSTGGARHYDDIVTISRRCGLDRWRRSQPFMTYISSWSDSRSDMRVHDVIDMY